jgi:hypothetical protein
MCTPFEMRNVFSASLAVVSIALQLLQGFEQQPFLGLPFFSPSSSSLIFLSPLLSAYDIVLYSLLVLNFKLYFISFSFNIGLSFTVRYFTVLPYFIYCFFTSSLSLLGFQSGPSKGHS